MTKTDVYFDKAKPIKIGVLMDIPERHYKFGFPVYDFIVDRYVSTGRLHRGVELIKKIVVGPPAGLIADVMKGYHELCDEGVLAVIGPNHSDNNIAITEHAEARKVPVMSLGAIHSHVSPHVFNIGWGSVSDDGFIIASWLEQNGHKKIALTYDNAAHCKLYAYWFRIAAKRMGLELVGDACVSEVNDEAAVEGIKRTVEAHRAKNPDAIAFFGTGASQINFGKAVHASGWDVPRIMNGAFFQANYAYTHEFLDGWVGTGLWDDDNRTLQAERRRFAKFCPELADIAPESLALFRDGMVALLEGISNAPILTPAGVTQGLEQVHMVPACVGGDRTVISFGPYDHIGHKGMDKMVVRRLTAGKLLMEGRFDPTLRSEIDG
jgi:ABC-type branched-subunit amino acid transport system substrate-binding protein